MDDVPSVSPGPQQRASPRGKPTASQSVEAILLQEISRKLDRVTAVLAAQNKTTDKQIDILSAAGCDSVFIGTVVGMEPGAVRMRQSRVRAKLASPKESAPSQPELESM